jgi:predicted transposase YbfD/YdcC
VQYSVTLAEVTPLALGLPFACTVVWVDRHSTEKKTGKEQQDGRLLVSSLPLETLTSKQWLRLARGHWSVESANHYRRDVSWREDQELGCDDRRACNLAMLRSALLGPLQSEQKINLKAVHQHCQRNPNEAIRWLQAKRPTLPIGL